VRFLLAALLLLGLPLTGCSPKEPRKKPLPVSTLLVQPATFQDLGDYTSTLEAVDEVKMAAVSGGRVQARLVMAGDQVIAGQELLRLRVRERSADVQQAQAALARSKAGVAEVRAKLEKDKSNFQRYNYLKSQGASSAQELDGYRSQYLAQQASLKASIDGVAAASAELEVARSRLSDKLVTAPIAGQVGDIMVKVGDVVKEGDPFTSIIRNDRLLTRIEIPSNLSSRTKIGLPVWLRDTSGTKVLAKGRISFVSPVVNTASQGLLAKAEFINPQGRLRSGERVRTQVEFGSQQQLAVPFSAVIQTAGQSFVYVLGSAKQLPINLRNKLQIPADASVAIKLPVRLGALQNNCYPVQAGIKFGDRLIASNILNLRNGTAVKARSSRQGLALCSSAR
jgi:RND family efflux transporter MFP subunit